NSNLVDASSIHFYVGKRNFCKKVGKKANERNRKVFCGYNTGDDDTNKHNSDRPILKSSEEDKEMEEIEKGRRIGSKPPSCEKKCYGCEPCEAVQVPTISSMPHLSPHYANYQPEGWRCHCAP
ncbi:hypothetical protein CARUB_v10016217mg, partial [Capsella rubella]